VATALTHQHRVWRIKVFVATWLSYVGFYFCRKPFSAAKDSIHQDLGWSATTLANIWTVYLVAYAAGQFLASQMGTILGPRRNVLIGMAVSIAVAVGMGAVHELSAYVVLAALLGLSQATGWSGNVGTMAGWFHKHERGRVMGWWSTNFTVGAIASGFVMGLVLDRAHWSWCFYTGALVLGVIWIQFYFLQRSRPEDVGLTPIDDPVTAVDESKIAEPPPAGFMGLSRPAWINLLLVAGFYFFAKFVRYGIWSWAAYFLQENYKISPGAANIYAIAFDLFGLPSVILTGYISDRYFDSRRAGISLIMLVGMMGATGLMILFGGTGVPVFTVLLALVGFTLFGPDALLTGAGAIDIGGRQRATFAAGMISGFGSTGAVVQEQVIGRMYDAKGGDLGPIFGMLFGSAAMATLFVAILVWRNRKGGNGI
jgi:sugar phosphate permease